MRKAVRIVVTRPADEAGPWAAALQQQGFGVLSLPLIDVVGRPDLVLPDLHSFDAVMWVSGNAVRFCLPAVMAQLGKWPAGVRCWAPGPGTAAALRAGGVPAQWIDAPDPNAPQFDSESLWAVVAPQMGPGKRLLLVRGRSAAVGQSEPTASSEPSSDMSSGREWLLQQCETAGARVSTLGVYQRGCPVWSDEQATLAAAAASDGSVWLFSSGEAVGHLSRLLPQQDWRHTPALATHPRIAQALAAAGFAQVLSVRPTVEAVLGALKPTATLPAAPTAPAAPRAGA